MESSIASPLCTSPAVLRPAEITEILLQTAVLQPVALHPLMADAPDGDDGPPAGAHAETPEAEVAIGRAASSCWRQWPNPFAFASAVRWCRRRIGLAERRALLQRDLAALDESLETFAALTPTGVALLRPNAELPDFRLLRWYAECTVLYSLVNMYSTYSSLSIDWLRYYCSAAGARSSRSKPLAAA